MNTPPLADAIWRKSSFSGSDEGNCVEVARAVCLMAVRDSKNPDGPVLTFGRMGWQGFVSGLKSGR